MLAVGNNYIASRNIVVLPPNYVHVGGGAAGPATIPAGSRMKVTAVGGSTFDLVLVGGSMNGAALRAQKFVVATDWNPA